MSEESRLAAVRQEIAGLKGRISALKEAKNAVLRDDSKEVDWEQIGKAADVRYEFKTRRTLRGHLGKVYAMQWGSGSKLVSASQDGKLIVWNADLDTKLNLVSLKMAWVMTCAIEQGGSDELVACGGLDNVCSVYRLKAPGSTINKPEVELRGHDGYLSSCRFLPGGQILTASGDSTCVIWDIARREKLRDFSDHGGDVMSVAVSPTDPGNMFCSGSIDSTVKVWDVRARHPCTHTFTGHESDVNAVDFTPDGFCVGTGSEDASSILFDLRAHGPLNKFSDENAMLGIFSVCFSKTGRLMFAGYEEHMCYAWETISSESLFHELKGHQNRVSTVGVNADGNALCTGSWDQTLMIWA